MNELINNALTQETPGKVIGLLGVAMFSLAFMLATSLSNASFSGSQDKLSDPFTLNNVVAAIDNTANSYSNFLAVNLFTPAEQSYAVYADNAGWVLENSGLAYALGFDSGHNVETNVSSYGQVAGATTYNYAASQTNSQQGGLLDTIYNVLIK